MSEVFRLTLSEYAPNDDLITRFVWRPLSSPIILVALRVGISANQITLAFILVGVVAALTLVMNIKGKYVICGSLLIIQFVLDLADGYVARYTNTNSKFGTHLDGLGHFIVNSCIAFTLGTSLSERAVLCAALNVGTGLYALFLTGKNYADRLGYSLSTLSEPSRIEQILGKIAVFPIENPGIGYSFILLGFTNLERFFIPLFMLSGALIVTIVSIKEIVKGL